MREVVFYLSDTLRKLCRTSEDACIWNRPPTPQWNKEVPMKEYKVMVAESIEHASAQLVLMAPAFMIFHDARVEAQPGDNADIVQTRWHTANYRNSQAKRAEVANGPGLTDDAAEECVGTGQWRCTVEELQATVRRLITERRANHVSPASPIPMLLTCPACRTRHIDEGDFATKPHHSHACQVCGTVWRPAIVPTVGVQFLPGFKNGA